MKESMLKVGVWTLVGCSAVALVGSAFSSPAEVGVGPEPQVGTRLPERAYSSEELDLLARLVHAEARGEPLEGRIAVANVVLNRRDHPSFPDEIREVIYHQKGGRYQFCTVETGSIDKEPSELSRKAARLALEGERAVSQEALFFYNPRVATSSWMKQRPIVKTIGNHAFAR